MQTEQEPNLFEMLSDSITGALQTFVDKITPKKKLYAPRLTYVASGIMPASQTLVLKLGGPTKGRFWYVRQLRAGGVVNPILVADGAAFVYVGPDDVSTVANVPLPAAQWKDILADGATKLLPAAKGYSNGEFRVNSQEILTVVFTGQTVGENIMTSVDVYEYPDSDENVEWVI